MNRTEVKKVLESLLFNELDSDKQKLINLIEKLVDKIESLEDNLQKSSDEINRLKGEKGKPKFSKKSKTGDDTARNTNHSSEADRKERGEKASLKPKSKKKGNIHIDRYVTLDINKDILPKDAEFKGYQTRVIQDIKVITDNVEFKQACYYSPSLKKTFIADLPSGYHGEFGPGIRALIITLYRDSGMTLPALDRFFKTFNIFISTGTLSKMTTERHDQFHLEKEDIITAGINSHPYQHIDDTTSKVKGKAHYTHILCNPYFTAYFTRPQKDRLTILEFLCRGELKFEISDKIYEILKEFRLSKLRIADLKNAGFNAILTRDELEAFLMQLYPGPAQFATARRFIRDELFSPNTCYIALNERIALSLAKKEPLLSVLKFSFLPLHNNPAELGARVQARIRDINLQTISENGTKSKDTFATIVQTARKLGVNLFNYIYDRVTEKFEMPALADLIAEKSEKIFYTT